MDSVFRFDPYEGSPEKKLVNDVAHLYCRCLLRGHHVEATKVLGWIECEVEKANVCIFLRFLLPLLRIFAGILQKYDIPISVIHQKAAQDMFSIFLRRCVGMEPAKSTTWARDPRVCRNKDCVLCPGLRDFLIHPEREYAFFKDVDRHLQYTATGCDFQY